MDDKFFVSFFEYQANPHNYVNLIIFYFVHSCVKRLKKYPEPLRQKASCWGVIFGKPISMVRCDCYYIFSIGNEPQAMLDIRVITRANIKVQWQTSKYRNVKSSRFSL